MSKYSERFHDRFTDYNLHAKYVSFFIKNIKEKFEKAIGPQNNIHIITIIAHGTEFAYYWPGIHAIESIFKAFGYKTNHSSYKVISQGEYEYDWKISKAKSIPADTNLDLVL